MAAPNSTCPKSTNWRELYRAAILELDPAKLPVRIPILLSPGLFRAALKLSNLVRLGWKGFVLRGGQTPRASDHRHIRNLVWVVALLVLSQRGKNNTRNNTAIASSFSLSVPILECRSKGCQSS